MALIDARTLPAEHTVEGDVCIIGGGAAGLSLADSLGDGTRRVIVLESGGRSFDERTQRLYDGLVSGRAYPSLRSNRLRFLGGTTNHWGGNVRPLDAIDMAVRPWVPHSGWPFPRAVLDPFYARARAFLGLPDDVFEVDAWRAGDECSPWPFEEDGAVTDVFPAVAPRSRRIGKVLRARLREARKVDVYLWANALELETDPEMREVKRVHVGTLGGSRSTVRARAFVLATGGIENPRLLLLSDAVAATGLGNRHDLVGRFFADHLVVPVAADIHLSERGRAAAFYGLRERPGALARGVLRLPDEVQRAAELQNMRLEISAPIPLNRIMGRSPGVRSLQETYRALGRGELPDDFEHHVANMIADVDDILLSAWHYARYAPDYPALHVEATAVAEPAPNPESRVTLGDERDELGQRRVSLDWRLSPSDGESVRRSLDIFARALGLAGVGRLRDRMPEEGFATIDPLTHSHHMGTTRMHDDPRRGVVDAHCRVHGIANLYVAGSSVFPTYGQVNPTFTILALAFRLADHLAEVLR